MSAKPGPVPAPSEPVLEAEPSTIDSYPEPPSSSGPTLDSGPDNLDVPGPSSTFIPREPSPPLPDLSKRGTDSDDESDDEVIAKLPIYLSPALYPHINLFQYPLQHRSLTAPTWANDRGKSITTRVKEGTGRIEVEVPISADVNVWREERASELGFVTDVNAVNGTGGGEVEGGYGFGGRGGDDGKKKKDKGKDKEKKREKEKWGDKIRLRSEVVPPTTGYYSGIIQDGALHLHPISKLVQLRTSLQYLDDYDQKIKERSARYRASLEEDNDDKKDKAKTGGLPPPRQNKLLDEDNDGSGSIKDFRNKMWTTSAKEEEDKWTPYEWREGQDPVVQEKFEALIVGEDKHERLDCSTRGLDYLDRT